MCKPDGLKQIARAVDEVALSIFRLTEALDNAPICQEVRQYLIEIMMPLINEGITVGEIGIALETAADVHTTFTATIDPKRN